LCGGATLEQIKNDLKQYLLQQKQQKAVAEYIRTMGQRVSIEVNKDWVEQQNTLARDNPVDKARASGRPSLIDFGSTGCRPCDMMTPILETLKKKYEKQLNVLFVHVGKEQIFAARYGIQSIPVQIFFDKDGKEFFRHTGFFPQDEIEKKLTELGVK
jgi:thioredoxin 1